jgi:hypothetical protein
VVEVECGRVFGRSFLSVAYRDRLGIGFWDRFLARAGMVSNTAWPIAGSTGKTQLRVDSHSDNDDIDVLLFYLLFFAVYRIIIVRFSSVSCRIRCQR